MVMQHAIASPKRIQTKHKGPAIAIDNAGVIQCRAHASDISQPRRRITLPVVIAPETPQSPVSIYNTCMIATGND